MNSFLTMKDEESNYNNVQDPFVKDTSYALK